MTLNKNSVNQMSKQELIALSESLEALKLKKKYRKIDFRFADSGPFPRDKYQKHTDFFALGAKNSIRAFIGGNGTGKTEGIGCEVYYHASGKYPHWWVGKRFNKPIKAWLCSIENKQLRAGMQEILFGSYDDQGTGTIPKEDLLDDNGRINTFAMAGTANCIGIAYVRHYDRNGNFDGYSKLEFKTYEQGWANFQGATRDLIWLDEEPSDEKLYSECLARLRGPAGKEGIMLCGFTPLLGYSTVYLSFLPNGRQPENYIHPTTPGKAAVVVTWSDVPHLSEAWKEQQIAEWRMTDPNSIDARVNGIAALGSGRIYPVHREQVCVRAPKIQPYWRRAFGLDFGWNATAALWMAEDPNTNIRYVYGEYKAGKVTDIIHAAAIKARGAWMTGAADPSGGGRKDDGAMRIDYYRKIGVDLVAADNSVISGIASILAQFQSGTLKICDDLHELLSELELYRYDTHLVNLPAKNQEDHLLDTLRYLDSRFDQIAKSQIEWEEEENGHKNQIDFHEEGRSDITGY